MAAQIQLTRSPLIHRGAGNIHLSLDTVENGRFLFALFWIDSTCCAVIKSHKNRHFDLIWMAIDRKCFELFILFSFSYDLDMNHKIFPLFLLRLSVGTMFKWYWNGKLAWIFNRHLNSIELFFIIISSAFFCNDKIDLLSDRSAIDWTWSNVSWLMHPLLQRICHSILRFQIVCMDLIIFIIISNQISVTMKNGGLLICSENNCQLNIFHYVIMHWTWMPLSLQLLHCMTSKDKVCL